MKNPVAVISFSTLSFDVFVRQAADGAQQPPHSLPEHQVTLTQDGRLLTEILSPVFSVKADRQIPSAYCKLSGGLRTYAPGPDQINDQAGT